MNNQPSGGSYSIAIERVVMSPQALCRNAVKVSYQVSRDVFQHPGKGENIPKDKLESILLPPVDFKQVHTC